MALEQSSVYRRRVLLYAVGVSAYINGFLSSVDPYFIRGKQTDASVCPLCLSWASILWGANRDASEKFKGDINLRSTNKYTKFGHLIIRQIIKIIATLCHILRLKSTKFDSWRPPVCLFVRFSVCAIIRCVSLSLRWSLTLPIIPYLKSPELERTASQTPASSAAGLRKMRRVQGALLK